MKLPCWGLCTLTNILYPMSEVELSLWAPRACNQWNFHKHTHTRKCPPTAAELTKRPGQSSLALGGAAVGNMLAPGGHCHCPHLKVSGAQQYDYPVFVAAHWRTQCANPWTAKPAHCLPLCGACELAKKQRQWDFLPYLLGCERLARRGCTDRRLTSRLTVHSAAVYDVPRNKVRSGGKSGGS